MRHQNDRYQGDEQSARRSTRIAADVLVEVQGERFAYAGETVTVNLHGALIRVSAPLKIGEPVVIYVQQTGKSAVGHVVFVGDDPSHFGVELEKPENIWGAAVPPEDWEH